LKYIPLQLIECKIAFRNNLNEAIISNRVYATLNIQHHQGIESTEIDNEEGGGGKAENEKLKDVSTSAFHHIQPRKHAWQTKM
jgi:hypothetical protein